MVDFLSNIKIAPFTSPYPTVVDVTNINQKPFKG